MDFSKKEQLYNMLNVMLANCVIIVEKSGNDTLILNFIDNKYRLSNGYVENSRELNDSVEQENIRHENFCHSN